MLVLAPHPDDETIAAGGLLQRARALGAPVRVVFATDGENNPWAQRAVERRWRIDAAARARFGRRRRGEALAALARLGIGARDVEFLGYEDQGLSRLLMSGSDEPIARLGAVVSAFRATMVVGPSPADLHPDHSALAVLMAFALARRVRGSAPSRIMHYVVHDLHPARTLEHESPATIVVPLAHRERVRKRRAILAHGTQLVLRRSMLLGRAADPEQFVLVGDHAPAGRAAPDTTVANAAVDAGVWLSIRRRLRLGACGATRLLLAVDGARGGRRYHGRLRPGASSVLLRDAATGASLSAAVVRDAAHRLELGIPSAALVGARRAFLKLERRFGFFDEAGWHPIAVPGLQLSAGLDSVPALLAVSSARSSSASVNTS